jgi:hypothetical protein
MARGARDIEGCRVVPSVLWPDAEGAPRVDAAPNTELSNASDGSSSCKCKGSDHRGGCGCGCASSSGTTIGVEGALPLRISQFTLTRGFEATIA